MSRRMLWWTWLLLAASCSTDSLLTAVESDVQKVAVGVPTPTILPSGGAYRQTGDLSGVSIGPDGAGLRLFYTTDGTNPAFNVAGNSDGTHTKRIDSGTIGWGTGAWTSGLGAFPLKAQYLTTDGRRSPVAQAVFRVVGYLGVESVVSNPAQISAVALSSTGLSAEAASGSTGTIWVRDAGLKLQWTQTIASSGSVVIRGLAFDGTGRLWACGNVQTAGAVSFGGTTVQFTPGTLQVGFLTSFDSAGVCQGVIYEGSGNLTSSMEGLAVSDARSSVYVAGTVDRTPGGANTKFRKVDVGGTASGPVNGLAPVNAAKNAVGWRFAMTQDYLGTLQNLLSSGGASDGFTSVDYDPATDTLALGGWGIGSLFEYDGVTPVNGMSTARVPIVVAADGSLTYLWAASATRTAAAGTDAQVQAVAVLNSGAVVAAGSQAPDDGVGWTWPDASTGTIIAPSDSSTAFWVRLSGGLATAGRQISSPSSITVTGLTANRTTGSIYTSYTLGAGTPSGWIGALAAAGSPSPWIVMTDPTLGGVGWWRSGGLGPGKAGPLAGGPNSGVDRLFTAWTASGTPAMTLGQGLTAPATSGNLLLRLFN